MAQLIGSEEFARRKRAQQLKKNQMAYDTMRASGQLEEYKDRTVIIENGRIVESCDRRTRPRIAGAIYLIKHPGAHIFAARAETGNVPYFVS